MKERNVGKATTQKWVYSFGSGTADGAGSDKALLGGKGANLAAMTKLGLPVPPGFTITTEACVQYFQAGGQLNTEVKTQILRALTKLEETMGRKFGDPTSPLLVSVRSGARASMPGMMDTVLNLGLNAKTVPGLAQLTGNPRFAWDSYRRLMQMYSEVVMGVKSSLFEREMELLKAERGTTKDTELSVDDLQRLVTQFQEIIWSDLNLPFPEDPMEQLWSAVEAVFKSWNTPRAKTYRRIHHIPEDWGTAVTIQAMVFGNLGEDSATGVAFTRDPSTGEKTFFGEFLPNAQGEDVVAGIRTPHALNEKQRRGRDVATLKDYMPAVYQELEGMAGQLEAHAKDMQDIEFTIEKKKLYLLQTRNGKRSASAAVKIAVDMVAEKLINESEAVQRVDPAQLDQLLHPRLDPSAKKNVIAKGLPASPGAASGHVVFSALESEKWAREGKKVILVRHETSPEDIGGMDAAQGILTALGGMTSHAAVVARGMGKCCVAGCGSLSINFETGLFQVGSITVHRGDVITLDGSTGEVILGEVPTVSASVNEDFKQIMTWVDRFRKLKIRANADSPQDARTALHFGAEGIGLCRTEHMFFEGDRIDHVREMILAETPEARNRALTKLEPIQQQDFEDIFRVMKDKPVTIRLLDPPLHEFLPHTFEEVKALARKLHLEPRALGLRIEQLKEFNPMLGHRGCRLGLSYPEIYRMQVRAIMRAATKLARDEKLKVEPEIMVPLISHVRELQLLKKEIFDVIDAVQKESGITLKYSIGTMIELPRAALTASQIALEADFFSFGTNDLTQTTLGLSRDDSSRFLPEYVDRGIFTVDPFVSMDPEGVGALVRDACRDGRAANTSIKLGVCGEHGGDPASIKLFNAYGVDYVSCSPYRIPIARLAAAHAALGAADPSENA